jgi:hypothetical protein
MYPMTQPSIDLYKKQKEQQMATRVREKDLSNSEREELQSLRIELAFVDELYDDPDGAIRKGILKDIHELVEGLIAKTE